MEPAIPANVSDISSAIPVAPAQFVYPGGRAEITTQIILVHGGWQGPEVFSRVVPGLERAGYAVSAVALPSAGLPVDADEDAKVIRSAIISAIELGKDVILVMHSYGAIPGCEALKGLKGKELEARARGWGKVLKLVFISALVLPVGSCIYPDERGNANKAGFEYEVCASRRHGYSRFHRTQF
jgi:pimeloyl-ACP methyl ester carboxylesterase